MSAAVWGFLGVALGGVLTGTVSLWQAQLVTRREREAREALREQEQRDRRDAFQRDTILALHDAFESFWALVDRVLNQALAVESETGEWPAPRAGGISPDYPPVHGSLLKLAARVFDDELRRLAHGVAEEGTLAVLAIDQTRALEHVHSARELTDELHSRVNTLLRDLF